MASDLKRKHNEIAGSQSDHETIGSDEEYGWTEDNNVLLGNEASATPDE